MALLPPLLRLVAESCGALGPGRAACGGRLVPRVCPGPSWGQLCPRQTGPPRLSWTLWGWPCPRRTGPPRLPWTLVGMALSRAWLPEARKPLLSSHTRLSHGCALGPVGTRSCSAKGHTAAEVLKGPGFLTPALRPLTCLTGCLPTPHHHPGPCQVSQGALPQQVAARSRGQI